MKMGMKEKSTSKIHILMRTLDRLIVIGVMINVYRPVRQ